MIVPKRVMKFQRIELPTLFDKQQKIFNSVVKGRQKFTVIAAGRRFGKTRVSLAIALHYAVNLGLRVWWVSPSHTVSDNQWELAKRILEDKERKVNIYTGKKEVRRTMYFYYTNPDGSKQYGELAFKSGDKPNSLRGEGIDLLIIDEAAFVDPSVWKVLRPALTDRQGQTIFISTPNGLNWFYKLCVIAQDKNNKYWRYWHFTSYDNPYIPKEEIDDAKNSMTKAEFEEEHLAIFSEGTGRLFRNVERLAVMDQKTQRELGHVYTMGIDFARKNDSTVISVVDITTGEQVWMDRWSDTAWAVQKNRIHAAIMRWRPHKIYPEANSAGQLIEELQAEYPNIEPVYMTNVQKNEVIQRLALAIDKGTIKLLKTDTELGKQQLNELRAFEQKRTRAGYSWTYGAPRGFHDDCVMALALAWYGVVNKPAQLEVVENKFYKTASNAVPESVKKERENAFKKSVLKRYKQAAHERKKAIIEAMEGRYH